MFRLLWWLIFAPIRRVWTRQTCPKCNGSGYLPQYSHVRGGKCFRCGGTGKTWR